MKSTVAAKNHIDINYFKLNFFSFHCIFLKFFCFQACYFLCFSITFFCSIYLCLCHLNRFFTVNCICCDSYQVNFAGYFFSIVLNHSLLSLTGSRTTFVSVFCSPLFCFLVGLFLKKLIIFVILC